MLPTHLRIIAVGDEQIGKTCLIYMLSDKPIPKQYTPTTYENFCFDKLILGQVVTFSLRDTAGRSSVDEFRSIYFGGADVFLLCFAADNRDSFVNLRSKWLQYTRSKVEDAKIILIETKIDLILPDQFQETNSNQDNYNKQINKNNINIIKNYNDTKIIVNNQGRNENKNFIENVKM